MRQTCTHSIYRTNGAQTAPPSAGAINSMMEAVEKCTERIKGEPHNPHLWAERASHFLALNYPELAIGDAYKARILLQRAPNGMEENNSKARFQTYEVLG
jgi:hypothetical protein